MLEGLSILMPAGFRLRAVRALADREGCCPLLYDFERSSLIDVPDQFRFHVAVALETGDFDEGLLAWLAEEDLLTFERRAAGGRTRAGADPWTGSAAARGDDLRDLGTGLGVGRVLFSHHRVEARLGLDDEASTLADLAALLRPLRPGAGAPPLTLVLGGDEPVCRFDVVRRVVAVARRHQRSTGREIDFALTVDPTAVTPAVASFLADHPFEVRVAAGDAAEIAAKGARRTGLRRLLDRLPERVTVEVQLAAGDRLRDLWRWAQGAGVRRFDTTRTASVAAADPTRSAAELRAYRGDLFDLCDDLYAALGQGRTLPLYEPVARTVRRLTAGRPLVDRAGHEAGYVGLIANGDILPLWDGQGADPAGGDEVGGWAEWADGASGAEWWSTACDVCPGVCRCEDGLGDPAVAAAADAAADGIGFSGGDQGPGAASFRRAEIEVATLFYGRLRAADAVCLLGFPADGPRLPFAALPDAGSMALKIC